MPLPEKNGAVAVVVQPSSETTLTIITPYGMLLLSLDIELDVFTVVSLTNFIKGRTEGARDTMGDVTAIDNPISAITRLGELEDQEKIMYALREIAETSEDAESVRVAFIALTTTEVGQSYMRENPIKL
jgi:hypothetical protein